MRIASLITACALLASCGGDTRWKLVCWSGTETTERDMGYYYRVEGTVWYWTRTDDPRLMISYVQRGGESCTPQKIEP